MANEFFGSPKHVVLKAARGGKRSTASPTRCGVVCFGDPPSAAPCISPTCA